MRKLISFLSLLGSSATLVCCVLPALFVTLGFGAAFASLVGTFPQLIWLSEHKGAVFGAAAVLLLTAGFSQWKSRQVSCPTNPTLAEACRVTKGWSGPLFIFSLALYGLGAIFAFGLPLFL